MLPMYLNISYLPNVRKMFEKSANAIDPYEKLISKVFTISIKEDFKDLKKI